jgi:RNA polymerase sigma-70 factor (ECF subfamily)
MGEDKVTRRMGDVGLRSASALPATDLLGLEKAKGRAAPVTPDEAHLIDRSIAGEDWAFNELVSRYQDMVYNLALRLLGNSDEALDLSQDVFFQVYRKLGSFRRDAALRTWIYRIVINRAKNRRRWWNRRREELTAVPIEGDGAAWRLSAAVSSGGDGSRPDALLERKELGAVLHRAMDALPIDQRSVLVLKEIEGMTYEEIAGALQVAVGTVKSRLARARLALRQELRHSRF